MYGVEKKIEWLSDFQGEITINELLFEGMDIDELFEIDNYEEFREYLINNSRIEERKYK